LLKAGDYPSASQRGYPDGFWWQFLMHVSELFTTQPRYISEPKFAGEALVDWKCIFGDLQSNFALLMRDFVLLDDAWLAGAKSNLDKFAGEAAAHRALLVANRVVGSKKAADLINSPEFLIVETDPIVAAHKAFQAFDSAAGAPSR